MLIVKICLLDIGRMIKMELGSRWVNGKEMRRGYTTGSCAAAAAAAAAQMLFSREKLSSMKIHTPKGIELILPISNVQIEYGRVICSVKKDGGDDPDVTHGMDIFAQVKEIPNPEIVITGGQGIGVVTEPGLSVSVGEYAINPVPLEMIRSSCRKVIPAGKGIAVIIFTPQGETVAKKTFNPRLGITGGISIIGTSGIVEPMSEEALKQSIALELSMLAEKKYKKIIFVPGNYGRDFATQELQIRSVPIIKISNYIGDMLEEAVRLGFQEILLVGDLGKLIKVSAGIFHTHSRVADGRMEILSCYAALLGGDRHLVKKIFKGKTTTAGIQLIQEYHMEGIYDFIVQRVSQKAREHIYHEMGIGTVLFSRSIGLLSMDEKGQQLVKEFQNE